MTHKNNFPVIPSSIPILPHHPLTICSLSIARWTIIRIICECICSANNGYGQDIVVKHNKFKLSLLLMHGLCLQHTFSTGRGTGWHSPYLHQGRYNKFETFIPTDAWPVPTAYIFYRKMGWRSPHLHRGRLLLGGGGSDCGELGSPLTTPFIS